MTIVEIPYKCSLCDQPTRYVKTGFTGLTFLCYRHRSMAIIDSRKEKWF